MPTPCATTLTTGNSDYQTLLKAREHNESMLANQYLDRVLSSLQHGIASIREREFQAACHALNVAHRWCDQLQTTLHALVLDQSGEGFTAGQISQHELFLMRWQCLMLQTKLQSANVGDPDLIKQIHASFCDLQKSLGIGHTKTH